MTLIYEIKFNFYKFFKMPVLKFLCYYLYLNWVKKLPCVWTLLVGSARLKSSCLFNH